MHFLPTDSLTPGMVLDRDIIDTAQSFMLKKGIALTVGYIDYLREHGYLGAYVSDAITRDIEPIEAVSPDTVRQGIKAVANTDIEAIMSSAANIVTEISALDKLNVDLINLRSFDDYTYHHSINVAVYSVAVGKAMGLDQKALFLLSQAAVCHDLGKAKIPLSILNKPDRLTDEEFAEIKNHSRYSYNILNSNPEVTSVVKQAVLLHHENENGTGYPLGKEGSDIPILAKIIHAVDVYDALTSKRPYKDPYSPADAFEYLHGGIGILFDGKVVNAMTKVIPMFPPGIDVRLSNGETAIVVKPTSVPARPIIRLLPVGTDVNLKTDVAYQGIFITDSGIMPLSYSQEVDELNESRQIDRSKPKTIILVDDSMISLRQTKSILDGNKNYNIIPLQTGVATISYINAKGAPDLLIMDIEMPTMNGITAVSNLRKMGYTDLPVIFLTSKCDADTVLKCRSVGATDYIVKPAKPTYLKERVILAMDRNTER